jgi:CRP-like cAMP-binding protein
MTPDAIALQLSLALLLAAALTGRLPVARLMIGLFALIGLARAVLLTGDIVQAGWLGLILLAAATMLLRDRLQGANLVFSPEEEEMAARLLSGIKRAKVRHLIDQGFWLTGREGDVLTREAEPVGHLYYIATGEARVLIGGHEVGICRGGDLVGELTVLSGESASATVILSSPSRFWCAPAEILRPYLDAHPDLRLAIERGFARALKDKLRATNQRIAQAGGVAPAE